MSAPLSDERSALIKDIAKSQGYVNYKENITSGSLKGDGYLGIIHTVNIQDENKPNKQLHLIMKSALSGEQIREKVPIKQAYEREIYMYETIFPELKTFSEEIGITNKFTETAKCYGSSLKDKEECLVLENLRENEFQLWNRKIPMNEEHAALVFKTYAKFHSTGLALKLTNPEKYASLTKNMGNIFYKEDESLEAEAKRFEQNSKRVFGNGFRAIANNEKATQAFTKYCQNYLSFHKNHVKNGDERFSTILHGDCWCNNMMFKYKDVKNPDTPSEMCLLDWQLSCTGSPILDLSYFFYASASKDALYNLKKFLKVYYETFSKTLQEAGVGPDKIFTYEELENQWKICSKFGLFMTLFIMNVVLSESEEAPDLDEGANAGKNILQSLSEAESINLEEINTRIADVIVFMYEHDYL